MLNTMIGASIFGIPSIIAGYLGKLSPAGYLIAFAGIAVIAACLAEVSSYFQEAGGPYLYTRIAFGRFAAIQIGWLTWLSRITACSGVANLFVTYLSSFFPAVTRGWIRATILTVLIGFLAAVNYRGVSGGKALSNFFTITKILLLTLFIAGGFLALALHPSVRVTPAAVPLTAVNCFQAILLMVYAYGGFEAALFASGEAERSAEGCADRAFDCHSDGNFALHLRASRRDLYAGKSGRDDKTGRGLRTPISWADRCDSRRRRHAYFCLRLPEREHVAHPARHVRDGGARRLPFSLCGHSSALPDAPHFHCDLCVDAHLILDRRKLSVECIAVGNFAAIYVRSDRCGAAGAQKKVPTTAAKFRLPAGMFFAFVGLAFMGVLLTQMHRAEVIVLSITFTVALLNWLWARGRMLGIAHES